MSKTIKFIYSLFIDFLIALLSGLLIAKICKVVNINDDVILLIFFITTFFYLIIKDIFFKDGSIGKLLFDIKLVEQESNKTPKRYKRILSGLSVLVFPISIIYCFKNCQTIGMRASGLILQEKYSQADKIENYRFRRTAAFIIDSAICVGINALIKLLFNDDTFSYDIIPDLGINVPFSAPFFMLFKDAVTKYGSIGKVICSLKITDTNGDIICLKRRFARNLGLLLSPVEFILFILGKKTISNYIGSTQIIKMHEKNRH